MTHPNLPSELPEPDVIRAAGQKWIDSTIADVGREIIESLRVTVKISVTTYELPSSTISSLFLSSITASRCPKFRPTEARTQAHTHARARSTYAAEYYQHFGRSLVPFSGPRLLGPRWAGSSRDPERIPLRPFLSSLSRERGHVTPWRRRNRRFEPSGTYVWCVDPAFMSGPGTPVCVRRLVRRWNAPVLLAAWMDGFVFAIWRLVPRAV